MRTTPRLVLRPFRESDLEPWAALNADAEVMRYLGGRALSRAESDAIAEAANRQYADHGYGFLAVERQTDGTFVGACGLSREEWYPDDLQLGWRLGREFWGHGYATEAAASWLDHAFTTLTLPRVLAVTDVPNLRSVAVMQRLGMTFAERTRLIEDGQPFEAVVYVITATQWRARS